MKKRTVPLTCLIELEDIVKGEASKTALLGIFSVITTEAKTLCKKRKISFARARKIIEMELRRKFRWEWSKAQANPL